MASCFLRSLGVRAEEIVSQTSTNCHGDHDEPIVGHK